MTAAHRPGTLRMLARRGGARIGMGGVVLLLALALAADLIASERSLSPLPDPRRADTHAMLVAPSGSHLLGTDSRGRDVLARLVHGTRASLGVGVGAVCIILSLGVSLGALSGFYGGRVDAFVTRATEVLLSFPTILVILAIRGITGEAVLLDLAVVIGLLRWTDVARLTRAEVLRARASEYVVAAHALGVRPIRILVRHVLPDAIGPALVAAPFGVAAAVLIESSLAFLGVGAPERIASWGELLAQARIHHDAWWLAFFPGIAIFVAVASFNLLGESLRDAIDPQMRVGISD